MNLNHCGEIVVHTTSTNSISVLQKLSCGSSLVVQQHAVLESINSYENQLFALYRNKIGIRFTSNIATKVFQMNQILAESITQKWYMLIE